MMGEFNSQMLNDPVPIWLAANFAKQQQRPDEDRIYAAFGRFVASYALAESALHIAARHFSGMPDDKARVVFSGMRQANVIDRLRSLIPSDKTDEVSELLTQFSEITVARNQFVHRLVEYHHGKGLSVTNKLTCRSTTEAEPRLFSLQELESLEYDCRVIFDRFVIICDQALTHGVYTGISLISLFGPWQYTRPQQEKTNQTSHGAPKSQKRQHRASPASLRDQQG
jgi:hypothetical protein